MGSLAGMVQEIETTPFTNYIVSSERFSRISAEQIERLRAHLPAAWQIWIVVYIRRQDTLLNSWWAQTAKKGGHPNTSFEQALPNLMRDFTVADYDVTLQRWEGYFGRANIKLRIFDEVIRERHILLDFLDQCDFPDLDRVVIPEDTNVTPSEKTIVLAKEIAKQLEDLGKGEITWRMHEARRAFFQRVLLEFAQQQNWNETKVNQVTPELYSQITNRYAEGNRAVAQRYFDRDVLFNSAYRPRPITTHDPADYTVDELKALIAFAAQAYIDRQVDLVKVRQNLLQKRDRLHELNERCAALQKNLKEGQAQRQATVLEGRAALLEQHNAQLAAEAEPFKQELALRRSMPLARASELLYAAQREWQQGGPSGFAKRLTAWLRGERRHTPVE